MASPVPGGAARLPPRAVYYAAFALSGVAGLAYQTVWVRYLSLLLGHAAYAQVLVLGVFLFGLAVGALAAGRHSRAIAHPLLAYAVIEAVLAAWALAFHEYWGFFHGWAVDTAIPAIGSPAAVDVFKFSLAAALILPQSVLLGATFPLMASGLVRVWSDMSGRLVSLLYFFNTIGAAAGPVVSGFVIIPLAGLQGVLFVGALLSAVAGLLVWAAHHAWPGTQGHPPLEGPASAADAGGVGRLRTAVLFGAFVTGCASLVYEVIWIRMLSLLIGSSTHSFEVMLGTFLLGIALGGLWMRNRLDRFADPLRVFGIVQVAMGLLALLSLPVYELAFALFRAAADWIVAQPADARYWHYVWVSLVAAAVLMLPTTVCAGMTLPLLTKILIAGRAGEGAIGSVYSFNTLGTIAGVALAFHFLIPVVGLKDGIVFAAAMDLFLGAAVLFFAVRPSRLRRWAALAGTLAPFLFAAYPPFDRPIFASAPFRLLPQGSSSILEVRHGKTTTVHAVENRGATRAVLVNGKSDGAIHLSDASSTADEFTMVMAALIPLLHKPDIRTAANIGFGTGMTTAGLLLSPRLERLDNIEIEPAVWEAARQLNAKNALAYSDPRSVMRFDDAKTFFASRPGVSYDLIISEPSNPWVSGVAGLFTREFYALVERKLEPDGMFVQWLQNYEIAESTLASVMKAFGEVFGEYRLFKVNNDLFFVAVRRGADFPGVSAEALADPGTLRHFSRYGYDSVARVLATRLAGDRTLRPYFDNVDVPVNSDYFPYLEYQAQRDRLEVRDALQRNLLWFDRPYVLMRLEGREPPPVSVSDREPGVLDGRLGEVVYATRLHEHIMEGKWDSRHFREGPRRSLEFVLGARSGCSGDAGWWAEYATRLGDLVSLLLAVVPSDRLPAAWERLAGDCPGRAPEAEAARLAFWESVAANDHQGVVDAFGATWDPGAEFTPFLADLLLMTVVAHHHLGNREAIAQLLANLPDDTPLPLAQALGMVAAPSLLGDG